MKQPRAVLDEEILVEHGTFSLIDPDVDYWRSEPDFTDDAVITIDERRIWCYSAGNDHYATVRVELWDNPPPPAVPRYDAHVQHEVTFLGRRLCLATTVGGPAVHHLADTSSGIQPGIRYLDLPSRGPFMLEVLVAGREQAAELDEATWAHGIEAWHIRIWPRASGL